MPHLAEATRQHNNEKGTNLKLDDVLYQIWAIVSHNALGSFKGHVDVICPFARADSIFAQEELQEILKNTKSINNVPTKQFCQENLFIALEEVRKSSTAPRI